MPAIPGSRAPRNAPAGASSAPPRRPPREENRLRRRRLPPRRQDPPGSRGRTTSFPTGEEPMPKIALRIALTGALLLALPAVQAQTFDRLVVFGTSLSDPGNAFALRGGTSVPTDFDVDPLLVPERPYSRGGHHFSNGPTWVEQLAQTLGIGASAQPAMRSNNGRATNYAVG